jgi:hypothetical protein
MHQLQSVSSSIRGYATHSQSAQRVLPATCDQMVNVINGPYRVHSSKVGADLAIRSELLLFLFSTRASFQISSEFFQYKNRSNLLTRRHAANMVPNKVESTGP